MRKNLLRFAGLAGTVALAAGLLAGCSTNAEKTSGKVELTFLFQGNSDSQKVWQKVFDEFHKSNPNITVKGQPIGTQSWADFFNKVSTQIAAGSAPDLMGVATEGQRLFASQGLLEPLDPYIAKHKTVVDDYLSDVAPNLVALNKKYTSFGGKTYYLPGDFNTIGMWVNPTLFKDAGVALPEAGKDWTWQEFEDAAAKIKEKTGAYIFDVTSGYATGLLPWVNTNGASVMNDGWTKATFDTPKVVEAMTYARNLIAKGYSPTPGGTFDDLTAFGQGKLATFAGGQWNIGTFRTMGLIDKTQLVRWPVNEGETYATDIGTTAYPILKSSKHKDQAWKFLEFLISKHGSLFGAQLGTQAIPARESVATSTTYLANTPSGTDLLYKDAEHAILIPAPNNGAEFQSAIEDGFKQILVGNKTPQQGAKETQLALEAVLK